MPKQEKFRISPMVVEAIRRSPTRFADIYRTVGKSESTWRWAIGRVSDRNGEYGVAFRTFVRFCQAINQLMGWDKSLEELCHPGDVSKLAARLAAAKPTTTARDESVGESAEDDS